MKCLLSSRRLLITLLLVAAGGSTASADWTADWNAFWHKFHITYWRNNAWPEPFLEVDAMQVVAPFEVMKRNGWRMHNTIGHELFREGDGALLAAGRKQIEWIATQAPAMRREVYVLKGRNDEETQARVDAVHEALAKVRVAGPETQVFVTETEPATAPGAWATKISRDARDQMAAPKLPSTSSSGAAGAAQSSNGSNTSN